MMQRYTSKHYGIAAEAMIVLSNDVSARMERECLSLREVARQVDLAPATVMDVIHGYSVPSSATVYKLMLWMSKKGKPRA